MPIYTFVRLIGGRAGEDGRLEFFRTNGQRVEIRDGFSYDLTTEEYSRVSRMGVFVAGVSATADPIVIPNNAQVEAILAQAAAYADSVAGGGGGGGGGPFPISDVTGLQAALDALTAADAGINNSLDNLDLADQALSTTILERGGEPISFSQAGEAVIGQSSGRPIWFDGELIHASLRCFDPPIGSSLSVAILLNGDVLFTLTIADGSTTPHTISLETAVQAGDELAANATSVGSTDPATGVAVHLRQRYT